jgi:hypothetical protein
MAAHAAHEVLQELAETEAEGEGEVSELEGELNPVRKVYTDAMMEHMAHAAEVAESEHEAAEAFLPLIPMIASKIAPLALKALPKIGARLAPKLFSKVMRVAPQLTRGVSRVARTLYRNPRTRRLLRAVPSIARRATAQLVGRAARGQAVTPRIALRTLARQTSRVLSHPRRCLHAVRRSRALDRVHHRQNPSPGYCASCGAVRRRTAPVVAHNGASGGGATGASCVRCC